jgi:hypothetical protein
MSITPIGTRLFCDRAFHFSQTCLSGRLVFREHVSPYNRAEASRWLHGAIGE